MKKAAAIFLVILVFSILLPFTRTFLIEKSLAGMPASQGVNYYQENNPAVNFQLLDAAAIIIFFAGILFAFYRANSVRRITGAALIIVAIVGYGSLRYFSENGSTAAPVFSPKTMLGSLWENYKGDYVDVGSGRTIDPDQNFITTSEGRSYTMLRAVWMDDRTTFDKSWQWTKQNLQRPDGIFSWAYGTHANSSTGILVERGGQNSATDADTDIAVALLFAYSRWENQSYLRDTLPIIEGIWSREVIQINGEPYLISQNIDSIRSTSTALVNPSYFAPYAYRMFSVVDGGHDWLSLVNTSYAVLDRSTASSFAGETSSGLPPDWLSIDTRTATLSSAPTPLTTNYSFDALRVPWRLALDWTWYGDNRAKNILNKFSFLQTQWKSKKMIEQSYSHDGSVITPAESPAMYGGSLGYFAIMDKADAEDIYRAKLISLYNPDTQRWKTKLSYYDSNIAWFGMALYDNDLPNLFNLNFK